MMKKLNTFYDSSTAPTIWVKNKYTSTDRLVIQAQRGRPAMGAVVNMRPDLFKAVVAQVPFVDVMKHAC